MSQRPRRSGLLTATRHVRRCLTMILLTCAASAGAVAAPIDLYALLDARLELMDEVAAFKWQRGLPIEDPEREAVVLDEAVTDGLRFGLTPASSRRLFAAQIDAAKAIQAYWFARWRDGAPVPAVVDLNATIRPELLRLGSAIAAAAAPVPLAAGDSFRAAVQVQGLDEPSREALLVALQSLEHYPDRLTQILDTGVLRIGTTGDYAPFSHRDGGADVYRGIDIDLGRKLAAALGVTAEYVATSWPTLMDDLAAGWFDVGMSGISRTAERARQGMLSAPYHAGGKAAIARCEQAARFARLADIDRPGVRVVVNPGGTNEQFVDARIRRATKLLHPDNRTIFEVIEAGRADVMITDRVEVELQAAHRTALCATMEGTLSYQEKAYLMPRDPLLAAFVATWLDLALADGTVAETFRTHGVTHRPARR